MIQIDKYTCFHCPVNEGMLLEFDVRYRKIEKERDREPYLIL